MNPVNKNVKRVIVDFKKLNHDILELLVEKFPNGYEESDIMTFRNASYELVEAVEVRTEDTIYLVKISKRLADSMENHESDDDDKEHYKDENSVDDDQLDMESDENIEDDFDVD